MTRIGRPPVDPMIRYEAKVDRTGGPEACHPWTAGVDRSGYGRMVVSRRRTTGMIHRWMYQWTVRPLARTEVVRHTCDSPPCQNPRHWLIGSQADNVRDAVERGRGARGAAKSQSKLTEEAVRFIRSSSLMGKTLAEMYGVSRTAISQVRTRQRWMWVD